MTIMSSFAMYSGCASTGTATENRNKVVFISIDGLRPEFYLSDNYDSPTLHKLKAEGAFAERVEPIFPSLTYPVHASLVTGVRPVKHGIISNTVFSFKNGLTSDWYWHEGQVKAPTLWRVARASGLSTAIIRWPASLGAPVDWQIPEIFQAPGYSFDRDWELIRKNTKPELFNEVLSNSVIKKITSMHDIDIFSRDGAMLILRKYKPDLTFIHFINLDYMQHVSGRESKKTIESLKEVDGLISEVLGAVDFRNTTVIITGDHGFVDFDMHVHLNMLFVKEGWLSVSAGAVKSWQVIAHAEGGQAAIYAKDHSLTNKIISVLKANAGSRYDVIERSELDKLGTYPDAICAVTAKPGIALGGAVSGQFEVPSQTKGAVHGNLYDNDMIHTGFIAVGGQVRRGRNLGKISVLDIAPTVARLLGFSLAGAERRPLDLSGSERELH
ncbi:MAG: ectonucleotide pyrophosphatase/phosphodiesterase [Bdellovibrionota bacterium]